MTAEHLILEAAKSPELASALRLLAEAEDGGQPRFPPAVCRAVAKAIVCRTYAPALHHLCHLVRGISIFRGDYMEFFWAPGPKRTAGFRAAFMSSSATAANGAEIVGDAVRLVYPDDTFLLAFNRMPFLAALMDFLMTTIGFEPVDAVLAPLLRPSMTAAEVSAQANALARIVYDWLKDHLSPLHTQRKFGSLVGFLKTRNGGDFTIDAIDDHAVLDFWQMAAAAQDLKDFRTFRSAFLAFARLRQLLDGADTLIALDRAVSIGNAREHGEVDPASIETFVEIVLEEQNPLDELATDPASRIKFLNNGEKTVCRFLFECGSIADALPVSFVRSEVFGTAQSRLSQALRSGNRGDALAVLIDDGFETDYHAYRDELAALAAHGRTVILASAHLLHAAGVINPAPSADIVCFKAKNAAGPSMSTVEAGDFMESARRAAKGISRKGFRPADLIEQDVREGFMVGVPLMAKVTERIETFLGLLGRLALPAGDWDAQFAQDKAVFASCFRAMYGETA